MKLLGSLKFHQVWAGMNEHSCWGTTEPAFIEWQSNICRSEKFQHLANFQLQFWKSSRKTYGVGSETRWQGNSFLIQIKSISFVFTEIVLNISVSDKCHSSDSLAGADAKSVFLFASAKFPSHIIETFGQEPANKPHR